ncbi:hypothetical protein [Streptococcus thoraltensis]|uniref:hypothetical protein n=1 Tax=Streptococcus thoraltensis TaxID=55085 RepID=UPI001F59F97B|nr:hypothetical protein [Streptococcus thoraltensis]
MIPQEKMTVTEMILMSYLVDISAWLKGQKRINQEMIHLTKGDLLEILKTDFESMWTDETVDYLSELSIAIGTLEEVSEAQFQELKVSILSWEPTKE